MSVTIPPIGIASTDLRRRVNEGRSIRYMVPRGVEAYIEAQGLYRGKDEVIHRRFSSRLATCFGRPSAGWWDWSTICLSYARTDEQQLPKQSGLDLDPRLRPSATR